MGNTIRREPVNFSIPASPDYKFLNITNFRGLDVSSNPFELATNTASDCLNVYVDETNTLTTRPRLDCKFEDLAKLASSESYVNTYPLSFGYLVQVKETGGINWRVYNNNDRKIHTVSPVFNKDENTFPEAKANVFEKDNKIYVLTSKNYFYIDVSEEIDSFGAYKADWVEGYIPTTATVAIDGTRFDAEELNLLSDKYKEKYFWDGISKLDLEKQNTLNVDNKYYTEYSFPENFIPIACYDDYSALGYYYDYSYEYDLNSQVPIYYITFVPKEDVKIINTGDTCYYKILKDFSSSIKPMTLTKGFYGVAGVNLYKFLLTGDTMTHKSIAFSDSVSLIDCSPSGGYCLVYVSTDTYFVDSTMTATKKWWSMSGVATLTDSEIIIKTITDTELIIYGIPLAVNSTSRIIDKRSGQYENLSTITSTPNGEVLLLQSNRRHKTDGIGIITYSNLWGETFSQKSTSLPSAIKLSLTGIGFGNTPEYQSPSKLFIVPDYTKPNEYYIFDAPNAYFSDIEDYNSLLHEVKYTNVFSNKYIVISNRYYRTVKSYYYIFNQNVEPLITVESKIDESNEEYSNWLDRRNNLLKSSLITRFDNNYWFASGNRYYRSENNDPTYFPITSYNDLGDSTENITGFNLANDTTLLIYKSNRLYLIQPTTNSSDKTIYVATESKNTVGNNAIGAPLVTTLTEIPIQINYDGVYGLSQVSNVSAVERIADLLSEPINDRWLNEDDEVIKKAQTLNRLYWTYIILPYEKLTKVYLLDNRTNSWYYWELPIKLLNAFAKDNRAEFVDADGNIYYLTTTDIRNMGFDTQLVTEYYDYGKKLIPWYWQSQVLYLGTMNYAKRLVNTTFILTDTDTQDGYGLQYSFKVFRKLASSVPEKELSGELNLVRSTTKKTNLSKFGFLQLKLSNITEESQGTEAEKAYRNNKLRLVGLGLKYVLLEGLIR